MYFLFFKSKWKKNFVTKSTYNSALLILWFFSSYLLQRSTSGFTIFFLKFIDACCDVKLKLFSFLYLRALCFSSLHTYFALKYDLPKKSPEFRSITLDFFSWRSSINKFFLYCILWFYIYECKCKQSMEWKLHFETKKSLRLGSWKKCNFCCIDKILFAKESGLENMTTSLYEIRLVQAAKSFNFETKPRV